MGLRNTQDRYGLLAKLFHWVLFIMLVGAMIGGNIDAAMPDSPEKGEALFIHKSFGLLILSLLTLRLIWRLSNPSPAHLPDIPAWQQRLANPVHWLLYLLMFAQPVTGILMSQASGYPVPFFGVFELPMLVEKNESLAGAAHAAHGTVWILLALLATGHAAIALHHHFVRHNDTLRRMGWGMRD